jgi:hypothetical protein
MGPVAGPGFSAEGVGAMSKSVAIAQDVQMTSNTAAPAAVVNEASLSVTTLAVAITFVIVGVPIGVFFALIT